MTCPNCKGELSRVWQPQRAASALAIAHVQWSCSTCGDSFSSKQLRPGPKRQPKAGPLQAEIL
jgi:hypothetical protein